MFSFVSDRSASRVVFGSGRLASLPDELERLGSRRVLLVANGSADSLVERATALLGSRLAWTIDDVRQHVPRDDVLEALAFVEGQEIDGLLAVGGGSAIGLAKAVALETGLPLLCVPTTYSGSEMTSVYGISSDGTKRTGTDDRVVPKAVIYDPRVTVSLPPAASAASGMNALAHCVEALYGEERTPMIEWLATEGMRSLHDSLPDVVMDGRDVAARERALYGSFLAGSALAHSQMALHHTLCHVLGGSYGLRHGAANSVVLPYVMAFNAPVAPIAVHAVIEVFGGADPAGALYDFARKIKAPSSLRELGVDESVLDEAADEAAASVAWNPRPASAENVRKILEQAWQGDRPAAKETVSA